MSKPKVLILDIETAPVVGYVWGLWDNNLSLNQIAKDWHILSWAAKWLGSPASAVMYQDQSKVSPVHNDKKCLEAVWKLLDESDIVITHNGVKFDQKKLNARFVLNGMKPPSPYRSIDTLVIAKKVFAFTSNKLEYLADKLCTKYKKYTKREFQGFELWVECLAGNSRAWKEMQKYNKYDVLALEGVYTALIPWDSTINFNTYSEGTGNLCKCGSGTLQKRGFQYTTLGKYQTYRCYQCGAYTRSRVNMLTPEKRKSLQTGR